MIFNVEGEIMIKSKTYILFTAYYCNYLSGSLIYVLEMCSYLLSKYDNVCIYIASPNVSDQIALLAKQKGVKICLLKKISCDIVWDVVFALHAPVLVYLLRNSLKYKKIINIVLSPFAELEIPAPFHEQLAIIVVNSEETKQKIIKVDNVSSAKIFVLPNFIPDDFVAVHPSLKTAKLKNIAVISNHVPDELRHLLNILKNVVVDYIGIEFEQKEITPNLLSQYDLIISIGKTVQYALGMCIPVFEYDKFGGCGYIYVENIDKEAEKNFSGRTTNRKLSAQQIAEEIKAGFAKAVSQRLALQKIALQYFSINNIDLLIKQIEKAPITPKINLPKQINLPDWIIRVVCCFIPIKKMRQKFRHKYRNRIA